MKQTKAEQVSGIELRGNVAVVNNRGEVKEIKQSIQVVGRDVRGRIRAVEEVELDALIKPQVTNVLIPKISLWDVITGKYHDKIEEFREQIYKRYYLKTLKEALKLNKSEVAKAYYESNRKE